MGQCGFAQSSASGSSGPAHLQVSDKIAFLYEPTGWKLRPLPLFSLFWGTAPSASGRHPSLPLSLPPVRFPSPLVGLSLWSFSRGSRVTNVNKIFWNNVIKCASRSTEYFLECWKMLNSLVSHVLFWKIVIPAVGRRGTVLKSCHQGLMSLLTAVIPREGTWRECFTSLVATQTKWWCQRCQVPGRRMLFTEKA